jgi:hypothetical protein
MTEVYPWGVKEGGTAILVLCGDSVEVLWPGEHAVPGGVGRVVYHPESRAFTSNRPPEADSSRLRGDHMMKMTQGHCFPLFRGTMGQYLGLENL